MSVMFNQVKRIINNIPKEEHHWFYHGETFKDSPYVKYRKVMYLPHVRGKVGGFIDVYTFDNEPETGIIVIAVEPAARGTGLSQKLVQKAIDDAPSFGIKKLVWRADTDNIASIKLAQKMGFTDISDLKKNPGQYTYEMPLNEAAKSYMKGDGRFMVVEPKVAASAPFNVDLHVDEYLEKANKKIAKYRSTHTAVPVPKRMFKKNPNKNRSVPYYYLTRWFSSTPYTIWLYPDDYCTLLFACTNGKCEVYLLDSYASTDYHEKLGEFDVTMTLGAKLKAAMQEAAFYESPVIEYLNEADIKHGKRVFINFSQLPKSVKDDIYQDLEKKGINKEQFDAFVAGRNNGTLAQEKMKTGAVSASFQNNLSIEGDDLITDTIHRNIEAYDESVDKAILESANIVKAYNDMLSARFDSAYDTIQASLKAYSQNNPEQARAIMQNRIATDTEFRTLYFLLDGLMSEDYVKNEENRSDLKRVIVDAMYRPSDNPEEIRQICRARVAYNKTVIAMFKTMLQANYKILGLTEKEALAYSMQLDSPTKADRDKVTADIKARIAANIDQYKDGNNWDLRKVGLGVILRPADLKPGEIFNLDYAQTVERLVQYSSEYDCIVVAHGSDENARMTIDKMEEERKRNEDKYDAKINQALERQIATYSTKWVTREKLREKYETDIKEINDALGHYSDLYLKVKAEYDDVYKKLNDARTLHSRISYQIESGNVDSKQMQELEQLRKENEKEIEEYNQTLSKYLEMNEDIADEMKRLNDLSKKLTHETETKIRAEGRKESARAKVVYNRIMQSLRNKNDTERKRTTGKALARAYDRIAKKHASENQWTTMPIKTPGGKTFTVMDDLVRQLIKEGFKKIFLMQCNPGKHQLAKDIRDTPGVTIRHSRTTALVENVIFDPDDTEEKEIPDVLETDSDMLIDETYGPDPFDRSLEILEETSRDLEAICESYGFTERFLNECSSLEVIEQGVISEGTISNIWEKLKEFVKKAIAFVVSIFRKIVEFFKKLITKIKDFFRKIFSSDKVSKDAFGAPVTHAAFTVSGSSASLNKISAKDWEAMRKITQEGCETISKEIDRLEKEQLKNMKDLEQYSAKQAQTVSESASPSMDRLIALML